MSSVSVSDHTGVRDRDLVLLEDGLQQSSRPVSDCKAALVAANDSLKRRFVAGESVSELVHLRSAMVDAVLLRQWQHFAGDLAGNASLVRKPSIRT